MRIELLYFHGCPSQQRLQPRLERLLREAGLEPAVKLRRIESPESAEAERFLGSPSVRVNDEDVEPGADERDDYALKCRLYRSDAAASGLPPDGWINAALERAKQQEVAHE